jgi:microcystin-dependent protein
MGREDAFLGEIRIFGGDYAPRGWAICDGRLLETAEHPELYALLGTTYGGGGDKFALPDLRGRLPVHQGPELTLGQAGGEERVTLTAEQIPAHRHDFRASTEPGDAASPEGRVLGTPPSLAVYGTDTPGWSLHSTTLGRVGGGQPHDNLQPYVCLNFIIALEGVTPSRDPEGP